MDDGVLRLTLTDSESPDPPAHLRRAGREWWVAMTQKFRFGVAELPRLRAAAEQLDRAELARRRIRKDGAFVTDRFGQAVEHPALRAEGRAWDRHERFCRSLCLDSRARVELPRNRRASYR
jgi:hypothetical protein